MCIRDRRTWVDCEEYGDPLSSETGGTSEEAGNYDEALLVVPDHRCVCSPGFAGNVCSPRRGGWCCFLCDPWARTGCAEHLACGVDAGHKSPDIYTVERRVVRGLGFLHGRRPDTSGSELRTLGRALRWELVDPLGSEPLWGNRRLFH